MITPNSDLFPIGPLQPFEAALVTELCGGNPLERPEGIRFFFQTSAEPAMLRGRVKYILPVIGFRTSEVFDVEPTTGAGAFMDGAKFYAGVLTTVRRLDSLPVAVSAVRELADGDPTFLTRTEPFISDIDVANIAAARIASEAGSFCELMDTAAPALQLETAETRQLALVGAGVLHSLAVDTITQIARNDSSIVASIPGMEDLGDVFSRVDYEFGNRD